MSSKTIQSQQNENEKTEQAVPSELPIAHLIRDVVNTQISQGQTDIAVEALKILVEHQTKLQTKQLQQEMQRDLLELSKELKNVQKSNEGYGYKYASIDQYIEMANPLLAKHNLTLRFDATAKDNDTMEMRAILTHVNGEHITSHAIFPYDISNKNKVQAVGSTITYARRYLMGMILNICSIGEDDDAASAGMPVNSTPPYKPMVLNPNSTSKASDKQISLIKKIMQVKQVTSEQLVSKYKINSLINLTVKQADELIKTLQGL